MKKSFQFIPISSKFIILRKDNYDFLLKRNKENNQYQTPCGCWKCLQNISLALRTSAYRSDRIIVALGNEAMHEEFVKLLRMLPEKSDDEFIEEVSEKSDIDRIYRILWFFTYSKSIEDLLDLIDDTSRDKALSHLPLAE